MYPLLLEVNAARFWICAYCQQFKEPYSLCGGVIGRSQILSNIARGNGVERVCFRRDMIVSGLSGHDNIADLGNYSFR